MFVVSMRRAAQGALAIRPLRQRLAALPLVLAFGSMACNVVPDGRGGTQLYTDRNCLVSGDTTKGPAIGTYFYHRNHINSSSVVTDANGAEVTRLVYLPYGELSKANSSGSDTVTSKFTGQEFDEETGLYYYGARYYEPAIGRFISADTIVPNAADGQAYNRYSYARDNPIIYTDPTGHSFWSFLGEVFFAALNPWAYLTALAVDAVGSLFNASVGAVQFLKKTATYAWESVRLMASDPRAMAMFLIGLTIAVASGGSAAALVIVLVKASIPIIAVSLARAAGVKNPLVLGLIGLAAGVAAGGGGLSDFLKGGVKAAAERIILAKLDADVGFLYSMSDFAVQNIPTDVTAIDNSREILIEAQDAAREDPAFQPSKAQTHCSEATAAIAEEVGAPTGPLAGKSANEQARALRASNEYREVTGAEAQGAADRGQSAVVAYENPNGSGHTATVRPQGVLGDSPPLGGRGPLLNNIGRSMGVMNENFAFRRSIELHYYVPNP